MLVKKELLTIPADEPSVQFVDLPKSGRVLAVYCDERGKHPVRFFSDGKNYTFLYKGEWSRANLFDIYGARQHSLLPDEIDRDKETVKLVSEFLNTENRYAYSVVSEIDTFIRNMNWERRLKVQDAKKRLQDEHSKKPAGAIIMKKLCDTCWNYAKDYQFCRVRLIKIGRNLVDYCREYIPKGDRYYGKE